jgi:DNA-binding CsgD family transcriptional regulator
VNPSNASFVASLLSSNRPLGITIMDIQSIHEVRHAFAVATSIDELTDLCRDGSKRLGFQSFIYALRVPTHFADARLIMLDGYPDGWVKRYFEQAYHDADPVMAYCANHITPIQWHELPLAKGSREELVMREAADFGLRAGITMPIHSPNGELGILSLALDAPPEQARTVTETALPYVQLLAAHLHEAVRRVAGLVKAAGPDLSPREVECLRWAADGKTSGEIAQILGLSESTINFHVNNSILKLDVINRQHAIGKAALQGLIQPKPF